MGINGIIWSFWLNKFTLSFMLTSLFPHCSSPLIKIRLKKLCKVIFPLRIDITCKKSSVRTPTWRWKIWAHLTSGHFRMWMKNSDLIFFWCWPFVAMAAGELTRTINKTFSCNHFPWFHQLNVECWMLGENSVFIFITLLPVLRYAFFLTWTLIF